VSIFDEVTNLVNFVASHVNDTVQTKFK